MQLSVFSDLKALLAEMGMRLVYANEKSLYIAGTRWETYTRKINRNKFMCSICGSGFEVVCPECMATVTKRLHVLADFLIGAHALVHADCILSRDLGVYKTYFNDLKVVSTI